MISVFPPALILIIGAGLAPLLKGWVRSGCLLILPAAALVYLLNIPAGTYELVRFLGFELSLRIDGLSLIFGYVFLLVTFIGLIYSLHVRQAGEQTAALLFAGGALGVVFAGDLITLFIFWELLALSATWLIWLRGGKKAQGAGFRYVLYHLLGGVCLMAGIIMRVQETGTAAFNYIGLDGLASALILLGVAVNAAIPPLHTWLVDAYPEASVTGTVFLSAFTTKSAVYVLARGYPGTELLIVAGVVMVLYPVIYAILDNDLRRVLSYSLINQVGLMVTGVGLGTALAINAAAIHAFGHILYKALLFMAIGAVAHRTGSSKITDLGGLYRAMPLTLFFCLVGVFSIAGLPLFSGFVSKSMLFAAVGHENLAVVWILLLVGSIGIILADIKIPYFAFFGRDSGRRPQEAPVNMHVAMGLAAALCLVIGSYPQFLYALLPNPVDYTPYTAAHVINQLIYLGFIVLAFVLFVRYGLYPRERKSILLDLDWVYRKALPALLAFAGRPLARFNERLGRAFFETLPNFLVWFGKNPAAALHITFETIVMTFSRTEKKAVMGRHLENQRSMYPDGLFYPWSIGAAVSFVLLIFLVHLFINLVTSL